jgi:HK97 family phage major capsid protein
MDSKITSQEMLRELNELTVASRAIVDRAGAEKRAYTGEENAEMGRMDERMNTLELEIQRVQKLEKREAFLAAPEKAGTRMPIENRETAMEDRHIWRDRFEKRFGPRGLEIHDRMDGNACATPEYRKAFVRYLLQNKANPVALAEYRALSVGDAAGGGYTVPQEEYLAELLKSVDNQAVIRQIARTFTVPNAQSLGAPTLAADPADPTWTGELLVGSEDSTMAFGKREMIPNPLAQYIKVSEKLLRASVLGMENIVRDRLAYKIATVLSAAYNSGTGVNQPLGLYTASTSGISTTRDKDVSTSNAYDADKFIDARYTLRSGYTNARWHFHRNLLAQIRKLKAVATGDYLWQPGLSVGAPNVFLDFPYVVDEYAPSSVTGITGGYIAILGDFQYYWIVDALNVRIQRLDELFALTGQVAFISRQETDGAPVLEDAFVRCKATIS